jgi:hypothetical protein
MLLWPETWPLDDAIGTSNALAIAFNRHFASLIFSAGYRFSNWRSENLLLALLEQLEQQYPLRAKFSVRRCCPARHSPEHNFGRQAIEHDHQRFSKARLRCATGYFAGLNILANKGVP